MTNKFITVEGMLSADAFGGEARRTHPISVIRLNVPSQVAGTIPGYATSSQYVGQVVRPLIGGLAGGHVGMPEEFLGTSVLMAGGAAGCWLVRPQAV